MATTPPAVSSSISEALARLWVKFLPEIDARTAVLEAATQALMGGSLSQEQREAAHQAAHKLAGVLGTFGLHRGTDLARQAEVEFAGEVPTGAAGNLAAWVAELRQLIETRK
jgi:HPt (histidine-containing phosphotransfer) domain-containing protein